MSDPFFSILLPSRNRCELLQLALASVLRQDFSDFEIIVADNASEEDYSASLSKIAGVRLRHLRSEKPMSVTANWNRALDAARGKYIIMLGDDDALTPGLLGRLYDCARRFEYPDVLYLMAYHYAYPDVFPSQSEGYFCTVNNSPVFDIAQQPFQLDPGWAQQLGRQALRFRHHVSFNAQHFVWRRSYIRKTAGVKPFYQSPYPDFFACFVTFLTAKRIVVVPSPEVIIGISKQSFGYFFANNKETEGYRRFFHDEVDEEILGGGDRQVRYALRHPGSGHYRNWLIAALSVKRAFPDTPDLAVDLRRYGRLQTFDLARQTYLGVLERKEFWKQVKTLEPGEYRFAKKLLWAFMALDRVESLPSEAAVNGLNTLLNIHSRPKIYMHNIGAHRNIMDAVHWIERKPGHDALKGQDSCVNQSEPDARDQHIAKLTRVLEERDAQIIGLNLAVAERDARVHALWTEIEGAQQAEADRDARVDALSAEIEDAQQAETERDARVDALAAEIEDAHQAEAECDARVDALTAEIEVAQQAVAERDGNIESLHKMVAERDHVVAEMMSSRSWRVTRPLRVLGRVLRNCFGHRAE